MGHEMFCYTGGHWTTGIVNKKLEKYVEIIPVQVSVETLQKKKSYTLNNTHTHTHTHTYTHTKESAKI
jgi:hypothetical protein